MQCCGLNTWVLPAKATDNRWEHAVKKGGELLRAQNRQISRMAALYLVALCEGRAALSSLCTNFTHLLVCLSFSVCPVANKPSELLWYWRKIWGYPEAKLGKRRERSKICVQVTVSLSLPVLKRLLHSYRKSCKLQHPGNSPTVPFGQVLGLFSVVCRHF